MTPNTTNVAAAVETIDRIIQKISWPYFLFKFSQRPWMNMKIYLFWSIHLGFEIYSVRSRNKVDSTSLQSTVGPRYSVGQQYNVSMSSPAFAAGDPSSATALRRYRSHHTVDHPQNDEQESTKKKAFLTPTRHSSAICCRKQALWLITRSLKTTLWSQLSNKNLNLCSTLHNLQIIFYFFSV